MNNDDGTENSFVEIQCKIWLTALMDFQLTIQWWYVATFIFKQNFIMRNKFFKCQDRIESNIRKGKWHGLMILNAWTVNPVGEREPTRTFLGFEKKTLYELSPTL